MQFFCCQLSQLEALREDMRVGDIFDPDGFSHRRHLEFGKHILNLTVASPLQP